MEADEVESDEMVAPDLDMSERDMLRSGLFEWGGPAHCTEELAVAMGFKSVRDLLAQGDRLASAITAGSPLTRLDWLRVLLATEIVFASNVVGSGRDWCTTTGVSDEETIVTLRRVQQKLGGIGRLRWISSRPE